MLQPLAFPVSLGPDYFAASPGGSHVKPLFSGEQFFVKARGEGG
jgi:hypothetical protein